MRDKILNHHTVTGKVQLANQFYDIEGVSLYFHLKIKTANHYIVTSGDLYHRQNNVLHYCTSTWKRMLREFVKCSLYLKDMINPLKNKMIMQN